MDWKKDMRIFGVGGRSRKSPRLVVGKKPNGKSRIKSFVLTGLYLAFVLFALGALPAAAVTVTWTGAVNGFWDTSTLNWSDGGATNYSDGDAVQFDDTASGSSPILVTNAVTVSPGGILVTNTTKNYTISGSAIAGNGSLTKSGAGTLILGGANTYTGPTTISAGTLTIGGAGLLGGGTYATNITNNGDFYYNSSANQILSGNISGTGKLEHHANGTLTLSGTNSYSGGTVFQSLGTLIIANSQALGTGPLTLLGGTLDSTVTTLSNNIAQSWQWDWTFAGTSSLTLGTGPVTLANNRSQTITRNTLTVGGAISGTGQSITKLGAGTLILGGANTYTGPTTISAGTLLVNGSISTNTVTVAAGATLGGWGTIGGPVTNLTSGTLAPGGTNNTIGTLVLATNATFNSGSYLRVVLSNSATAGTTYDQLVIKGSNTVNGSNYVSLAAATGTIYKGTYVLINNPNFAAAGNGLFVFPNGATNLDFTTTGGGIFTLINGANSLVLNVSADTPAVDLRPTNNMPTGLVIASGDKSVILHWEPNSWTNPISGYNVYRSLTPTGPFVLQDTTTPTTPGISDVTVANGQVYYYQVTTVLANGQETVPSAMVSTVPQPFANDDAFLDYVQQASFSFYWYDSNPDNGLSPEANDSKSAEIFGSGFALTAIGIGIDHGWITRAQGVARVITTLNTFLNGQQGPDATGMVGYNGWFYGVLGMTNAVRSGTAGLSDIDTAFLLCGILYAKQYFDGTNSDETTIRTMADAIVNRVDWYWMAQGTNKDWLPGDWSPESGFSAVNWGGYSEGMIMYQLGLGAATNPLPTSAWGNWTKSYRWITNYNTQGYLSFPSGFMYNFGQCWTDLRHVADAYMTNKNCTYFENSRHMVIAHRNYCSLNPSNWPAYGSNCWGLNPSQDAGVNGLPTWSGHGVPPNSSYVDDGTIAPCVAGSAIAFAPEYAVPCLRNMYDTYRTNIWIECGFCDAFNLRVPWFATKAGNEESRRLTSS